MANSELESFIKKCDDLSEVLATAIDADGNKMGYVLIMTDRKKLSIASNFPTVNGILEVVGMSVVDISNGNIDVSPLRNRKH